MGTKKKKTFFFGVSVVNFEHLAANDIWREGVVSNSNFELELSSFQIGDLRIFDGIHRSILDPMDLILCRKVTRLVNSTKSTIWNIAVEFNFKGKCDI